MATRDKNTWIILLFIVAGLVIGGLLGEVASQVDWLSWLAYGQSFGIKEPFVLNIILSNITLFSICKANYFCQCSNEKLTPKQQEHILFLVNDIINASKK